MIPASFPKAIKKSTDLHIIWENSNTYSLTEDQSFTDQFPVSPEIKGMSLLTMK
jgi:hypothetical protein